MSHKLFDLVNRLGGLNAHQLRYLLVILTLILFVIGAGAPAGGGGYGGD